MTQDAIAQRDIEEFEEQFGEPHLDLACHAAFPLVLNPDLLYRLWANFQRDAHGGLLGIPWIAVADLLLSSLCQEIGFETYRISDPVRNLLLKRLHEERRFRSGGRDRMSELGEFLRQYVQEDLESNQQPVREIAEAQRWSADAITRPQELVESLTAAYAGLQPTDRSEHLRRAALLQTFSVPLSGWARPDATTSDRFEALVIYSRGMAEWVRGNEPAANEALGQVAGKVALPMPAGIAAEVEAPPAPRTRRERIQAIPKKAAEQPGGWEGTIVEAIRRGRCVPILGSWVDFEWAVGVTELELGDAYALRIGYPFASAYRLGRLVEYRRADASFRSTRDLRWDFLNFVKNTIYRAAEQAGVDPESLAETEAGFDRLTATDFAARLGYPRFDTGKPDPLLVLADLPLPVYVTLSYFGFLEEALRRVGKNPRSEAYRPRLADLGASKLRTSPGDTPTAAEPLVYHLLGTDSDPDTLVLTDDDCLDLLRRAARGRGNESLDIIPVDVRASVARSAMLLLGHDLEDLRWRVLNHALLQGAQGQQLRGGVFQMGPAPGNDRETAEMVANHLVRSGLTPFWGTPASLLAQLAQRFRDADYSG